MIILQHKTVIKCERKYEVLCIWMKMKTFLWWSYFHVERNGIEQQHSFLYKINLLLILFFFLNNFFFMHLLPCLSESCDLQPSPHCSVQCGAHGVELMPCVGHVELPTQCGAHALCRVGGANSQLDLPFLTPLSVPGCGWLQLGVPHWAASVITASSW